MTTKLQRRKMNLNSGYWKSGGPKPLPSVAPVQLGVTGPAQMPITVSKKQENIVKCQVIEAGNITVRVSFNDMTVPELRRFATSQGIKGAHRMRRDEVIAALEAVPS